jgi:hypothetical protein
MDVLQARDDGGDGGGDDPHQSVWEAEDAADGLCFAGEWAYWHTSRTSGEVGNEGEKECGTIGAEDAAIEEGLLLCGPIDEAFRDMHASVEERAEGDAACSPDGVLDCDVEGGGGVERDVLGNARILCEEDGAQRCRLGDCLFEHTLVDVAKDMIVRA